MLTKQERNATAERLSKCEGLGDLYYAVIGEELPTTTSYEQDVDAIFTRLSDLCDTSNMLELPVGKDGEVIRIGDTVYHGYDEHTVTGYVVTSGHTSVVVSSGQCNNDDVIFAEDLTHKPPVTTRLLAQRIRDVLDDENTHIVKFAYVELNHIADIMESLADNDE